MSMKISLTCHSCQFTLKISPEEFIEMVEKESEMECSHCGESLCVKPHVEGIPLQQSPYNQAVEKTSQQLIEELLPIMNKYEKGVQQCALFHLEEMLLGKGGHLITLKFGQKHYVGKEHCSACLCEIEEDKGMMVEIRDRWRQTASLVFLCEKHSKQFFAVDLNLHLNNWPIAFNY